MFKDESFADIYLKCVHIWRADYTQVAQNHCNNIEYRIFS